MDVMRLYMAYWKYLINYSRMSRYSQMYACHYSSFSLTNSFSFHCTKSINIGAVITRKIHYFLHSCFFTEKSSSGVQHYPQPDLHCDYQTCKPTVALHCTAQYFLFNVPICHTWNIFWAVQESTFNGDVNHRQHFTLIDEIARQFCALHLIIWMSPKAILASWNTLGITTLSVQITRKNVTASTNWGRKKPDSSVLSALNNEVEPAELRDWQGRCFLALLVQPIGCRFPSSPGPSAAFSSFTLTFH